MCVVVASPQREQKRPLPVVAHVHCDALRDHAHTRRWPTPTPAAGQRPRPPVSHVHALWWPTSTPAAGPRPHPPPSPPPEISQQRLNPRPESPASRHGICNIAIICYSVPDLSITVVLVSKCRFMCRRAGSKRRITSASRRNYQCCDRINYGQWYHFNSNSGLHFGSQYRSDCGLQCGSHCGSQCGSECCSQCG